MLGDGPQAGEKGPEKAEHSTQVGLPDLPGPGYCHHGVVGAAGLCRLQPGVEIIANFRVEPFPRSVLNIFFTYLPGSGKRQDWVYLSSEQGVFNEMDFNIVIMASFEAT
jgi:hypothetical protein